jgi:hypothetical protein
MNCGWRTVLAVAKLARRAMTHAFASGSAPRFDASSRRLLSSPEEAVTAGVKLFQDVAMELTLAP